ncbi:DNA-deoxyinosine glycosylase [uncultured Treponema sp.]|uniref:DNA-deoxyinosine glycosylase n=1 Tax=uncultured Treponema sp. TaxID=162155 RepID=UPI0027D9C9F4|nr:DNA-deoxyinosine glycosylase [uncultured Treponema sp.]
MHVIHEIGPVWNTESRILFLGTMPSPASRLAGFYYMHPRNRFWPVMEKLFGVTLSSVNDRRTFLLQNNIALWDVLCGCDIDGAQDSSIKNAVPNDFTQILDESKISRIFCTGKTALSLYEKLCAKNTLFRTKVFLRQVQQMLRGLWKNFAKNTERKYLQTHSINKAGKNLRNIFRTFAKIRQRLEYIPNFS